MIVSHHTACTRTSAATNQHLDPRTYQRQNNGLVLAHKCASTKVPADHTCVYSALVNSRTLPQTPILAVIQAKGSNKSAHGGAAYRVLLCKRRPEGRSDTNRSVFEQANLWAPQANSRSPAQGLRRPCAARDLELCSGVHSTRSLDPVQAGPQCATLSRPGCSLASQPQHRRPAARRRRALRHPLIARSARGGPTKLVCKHQGTRWGPNEWRRNWCAQRTRWVATPPKDVGRANRQICGYTTPLWLSHPISNPPFGRARRTNEQPTSVPPLGVQLPN